MSPGYQVYFTRRHGREIVILLSSGDKGTQRRDIARATALSADIPSKEQEMTTPLPYDSAEHFLAPEDQAELLVDAFGSGDAGYIKHALNVVARAHGMTNVERDTGIKRQAIYRALGKDGNPTLDTLLKVTGALGLKLKIEPAAA